MSLRCLREWRAPRNPCLSRQRHAEGRCALLDSAGVSRLGGALRKSLAATRRPHRVAKVVDLKRLTESRPDTKPDRLGRARRPGTARNIAALDFFHTLCPIPPCCGGPSPTSPPGGEGRVRGGGKVEVVIIEVDTALFPVLDRYYRRGRGPELRSITRPAALPPTRPAGQVPARAVRGSLIFTLADDNVRRPAAVDDEPPAHAVAGAAARLGGFSTRYWDSRRSEPSSTTCPAPPSTPSSHPGRHTTFGHADLW